MENRAKLWMLILVMFSCLEIVSTQITPSSDVCNSATTVEACETTPDSNNRKCLWNGFDGKCVSVEVLTCPNSPCNDTLSVDVCVRSRLDFRLTSCVPVVGVCGECPIGKKCVNTGDFNAAGNPLVTCVNVVRVRLTAERKENVVVPSWQTINQAILMETTFESYRRLFVDDFTVTEYTNKDSFYKELNDDTVEFHIDVFLQNEENSLELAKELSEYVGKLSEVTLLNTPFILVRPGTEG